MNQQGGNKRDSPAPGALRGNISFEVGLPALALFLQTLTSSRLFELNHDSPAIEEL